jgi:hypothetical protein
MKDLRPARLNPSLVQSLVSGVDEELADIDQRAIVAQRDGLLIELLQAKRDHDALP